MVIPFAVESVAFDSYFGESVVADFLRFFVLVFIQPGVNLQAGFGFRRADKTHHDLVSFQRNALPITRDVAEQTMFDLVPLTRSWRIVTQLDLQTCSV